MSASSSSQPGSSGAFEPDVEKARDIAFLATINGMGFHEIALRSAFEAEHEYLKLARSIVSALGVPKGVRSVEIEVKP